MYLNDCILRDPSQVELLLLGSEAAYEAAKLDRDRFTQALMQIEPSFVHNGDMIATFENQMCQSVIAALGVGVMFPGDLSATPESGLFNIANLRYGDIIIVTEANEAGRALRNEILHFFFDYMRPLMINGHIFVPEKQLMPGFTQEEFVECVLSPETGHLIAVDCEDSWETTVAGLE